MKPITFVCVPIIAAAVASRSAAGATPTLVTLATFNGTGNGATPDGGLTLAGGTLYGTTSAGGANGDGTVFQLGGGIATTVATFNGAGNGAQPLVGLTADASGNLYGTTSVGGASNVGTVFEVAVGSKTISTLATFTDTGGSGNRSLGSVVLYGGNVYGTTQRGGPSESGTVYEVKAGSGTATSLATFNTNTNGSAPNGDLAVDAGGNLYGTTFYGIYGTSSYNNGTVFELKAGAATVNTVASFTGTANGNGPRDGLVADAAGNLYGATENGGANGGGTVFEIKVATGTITTLATFGGTSQPSGGVLVDSAGNVFGTTLFGGANGDGTVFEVKAGSNAITTLVTFAGTSNGSNPIGDLITDGAGDLFGTTEGGGTNGDGTAFEITAAGVATPEPTSLLLAAAAVAPLAMRRRRRRSPLPPPTVTP